MGDGAATISADSVVLFANRRLAELVDRPREALLGRPFADLMPGGQQTSLERQRKVSPGRSEHAELELLRGEGDTIRVLAAVSGLRNGGSETQCLIITDLSGIRPIGRSRASSDHRYRLLADVASAIGVETDAMWRVSWVTSAFQATPPAGTAACSTRPGRGGEHRHRSSR